jgi:hypothetical protein
MISGKDTEISLNLVVSCDPPAKNAQEIQAISQIHYDVVRTHTLCYENWRHFRLIAGNRPVFKNAETAFHIQPLLDHLKARTSRKNPLPFFRSVPVTVIEESRRFGSFRTCFSLA